MFPLFPSNRSKDVDSTVAGHSVPRAFVRVSSNSFLVYDYALTVL